MDTSGETNKLTDADAAEPAVAAQGASAMTGCERSNLMSHYHDGTLSAGERENVERHLRDCPACTAELDSFRAISNRLRALETPRFPNIARERLMQRYRQEIGTNQRGNAGGIRLVRWLTLAAAAVFLLALSQLFLQTWRSTNPVRPGEVEHPVVLPGTGPADSSGGSKPSNMP